MCSAPAKPVLPEAILMAGHGRIKVISIDYRMPPDFPYPAAIDDAMAVYKEVVKTTDAKKIGIFGTSTGGGMTLVMVLRAKAEGLPLPGAIAPGTPWSDMTKTGDTYFANEMVDDVLVSNDGWLGDAATLYANGHDLKDPMLSPVYGDLKGFPPTILTTGTRDLFLSNTVRVHRKLREAGVVADSARVRRAVARPIFVRRRCAGKQGTLRRNGGVLRQVSGEITLEEIAMTNVITRSRYAARPLLHTGVLFIVFAATVFALTLEAQAQDAKPAPEARIIVVGDGQVTAAPDYARIRSGVTTRAKTAKEAADANSKAMAAIMAALTSSGIEQKDIQTSRFSVQPVYVSPAPNTEQS